MATNSREARRRRILERGSDRLALITGRIQTLPSSSSSPDPQTQFEDTTTNPSSPPPTSDVQDQIAELPSEIEENESDSTLPRSQSDTNTEALRAIDTQVQQLLSSLTAQNAPPPPSQNQRRPLFTASGVSSAIAETERTRLLFSVAVAMLVVLVHLGFPLMGTSNIVKTLLGFRPLYLVLLTNVTFVLARILGKQRASERPGEIRTSAEGIEWVAQLGRAVEIGLVAQKVLDALFMDCAVYAIIVVCGLSSA
ncbi:hypothetical protein RchiOBHm_Chr6g0305551 [Rosa chinensis]|uniref:Transmembrane protein n=1 Tax=Rosa chinensis TaxID=74649 RepID=A0A2P6PZU0_ROSCH|nr:uncharacterized protein LOC112169006 [Rosa chinensis]PRQ27460.1 hypothetical protein RchiOBHm_Chr6g0305551 [Rosa chinensis]